MINHMNVLLSDIKMLANGFLTAGCLFEDDAWFERAKMIIGGWCRMFFSSPQTLTWYMQIEKVTRTVLTCVCGRSEEARSFTSEDLLLPFWFPELCKRIKCYTQAPCSKLSSLSTPLAHTWSWSDVVDCLRCVSPFVESLHFSRRSLPLSLPLPLWSDSSFDL